MCCEGVERCVVKVWRGVLCWCGEVCCKGVERCVLKVWRGVL